MFLREEILLIFGILAFILFDITLVLFVKFKKKTKRQHQTQNEFMAVMIHELRSPLSVVRSSSDMMLKEADNLTAEQIQEMLVQIKDSSSDLLSIVNNLLDVSKIEAGKVEIFKSDCDVNKLMRKESEYYGHLAEKKGIELKLELDESLDVASCDNEKLSHIMNNLLSNAIKYTDAGTITLETRKFNRYFQVSVTDTGKGISDEEKKMLFNKFTRVEQAANSKEEGTGLGLVIVKGMIEAHGGRIWIEDSKPHGSKFNFTLPL